MCAGDAATCLTKSQPKPCCDPYTDPSAGWTISNWLQLFLLTDVRFFCALFHPRLRAPPMFLLGLDLSIDFCLAKFLPYIFITHHAVVGEIWKALPCSAFSLIFVFLEFEVVNQFSYKTGVDTQNVVRLRSWSCGGFYPHPLCYSGSRIVASPGYFFSSPCYLPEIERSRLTS